MNYKKLFDVLELLEDLAQDLDHLKSLPKDTFIVYDKFKILVPETVPYKIRIYELNAYNSGQSIGFMDHTHFSIPQTIIWENNSDSNTLGFYKNKAFTLESTGKKFIFDAAVTTKDEHFNCTLLYDVPEDMEILRELTIRFCKLNANINIYQLEK